MFRNNPLKTILITTAITFASILMLYAVQSGRNPVNRMGFAFFISALPAVLTFAIIKFGRLSDAWWRVVLVYLIVLVATIWVHLVVQLYA